jgi:RND family efflux transporter MFP subunit
MKTKIFFILVTVFLTACGGKNKVTQLEDLKRQRDKINSQISQLEAELGNEKTTVADNSIQVVAMPITFQPFNHYIEVQGKLDGDQNLGVSAQNMGIVKSVLVNPGDKVGNGQILAQLDDAVIQQGINEVKSALEFATSIYTKQKALWDQKIGSEVQFLTAKNNKESLENKIKTLKEQMDMMVIKSPIAGSVEEVSVKVGQAVSPGLPVFRVVNFNTLKVSADISESYASKVKKGDEVVIFFPDIQKEVKQKISFTSNYINPINRTFQIEVKFSSPSSDLKANMVAVVKIRDYFVTKAIAVPINMVQSDNSGNFIFIAESTDGKTIVRKRKIKQGQSYNGMVEILEGIKENDILITTGFQNLEDGQSIKI